MNVNDAIAEVNFAEFGFTDEIEHQVVKYIKDNAEYMHEVSPDMVTKVAELALLCPDDWEMAADMVVLTLNGRMRKITSWK